MVIYFLIVIGVAAGNPGGGVVDVFPNKAACTARVKEETTKIEAAKKDGAPIQAYKFVCEKLEVKN